MTESPEEDVFQFRPWIRRACRKAMVWGVGVVVLLGAVAWVFRTPGSAPLSRAFGVLLGYSVLFWASLAKIWWTAGEPAVLMDEEALHYQPLHGFRRRSIAFGTVMSCAPRIGTQSLRFVHEFRPGRGREFFLNLGVVDGRNEFLDCLGDRLQSVGVIEVQGVRHTWERPGWSEEA